MSIESVTKKLGGIYNNWPIGRGLYLTPNKEAFLWINESEHLLLGTLQKDANLKKAFERTFILIRTLSEHFEFVLSPTWGYPTMNPALVGM